MQLEAEQRPRARPLVPVPVESVRGLASSHFGAHGGPEFGALRASESPGSGIRIGVVVQPG